MVRQSRGRSPPRTHRRLCPGKPARPRARPRPLPARSLGALCAPRRRRSSSFPARSWPTTSSASPARAGERLALLAADQILLVTPFSSGTSEAIALDPPAPAPTADARVRAAALHRRVGGWECPVGVGADPAGRPHRPSRREQGPRHSAFPLLAEYTMAGTGPPPQDELLAAGSAGPALPVPTMTATDGWTYSHSLASRCRSSGWAPAACPRTPTRRLSLRVFTAAEELRHKATSLRIIARDLDGDGRADLMVHRTSGTLLRSHSVTAVYRNRGDGVRLEDPPWLLLDESDALSSCGRDRPRRRWPGRTRILEDRVRHRASRPRTRHAPDRDRTSGVSARRAGRDSREAVMDRLAEPPPRFQ